MATLAEVLDAYDTNADYDVDESASKCRLFIAACRRLLSPGLSPKRSIHGGRGSEEIELDLLVVQNQLESAQDWLASFSSSDSGSNVTHVDFQGFRG